MMATTTTNQNGDASFSQVSAGTHPISVSKSGYQTHTGQITVSFDGQTFQVTLTSTTPPGYRVTIQVTDSAGVPVSGASVTLT